MRRRCCCNQEQTIEPCSGALLLIDPADYFLQANFTGGTYTAECNTCTALPASFLMTYDSSIFAWKYINNDFGNYSGCATPSQHSKIMEIAIGPVCSSGKLGFRGSLKLLGSDLTGSPTDRDWMSWSRDGITDADNGELCVGLYHPLSFVSATSIITIGTPIVTATLHAISNAGAAATICNCLITTGLSAVSCELTLIGV